MGPGAASVWDPELGRRIEGIQPAGVSSIGHKMAAEMFNRHPNDYMDTGEIFSKSSNWPRHIKGTVKEVRDAVEAWQGSGGYGTRIGAAAKDYIQRTPFLNARSFKGSYSPVDMQRARSLIMAIRNAPERQGTLYRTMSTKAPIQIFEDAKVGDVIKIDSLSSFSRSKGMADAFLHPGLNPYRIVIDGRYKGLDAKVHGDFAGEKEVITYGRFRVVRKFKSKPGGREFAGYRESPGITNIVLRQLETHYGY